MLNSENITMGEIQFEKYRVPARKDLLDFISEREGEKIYSEIGKDSKHWIEELSRINHMLTRESLFSMTGCSPESEKDTGFIKLGENIFIYRGKNNREKGLWLRKEFDKETAGLRGKSCEWTHYNIGSNATLYINQNFKGIQFQDFLPENFELRAKKLKKGEYETKRPILKFSVPYTGKNIEIFAKGANVNISFYYTDAKPSYRLTHFASVSRTNSKKEMNIHLDFASSGIHTPEIVGYYEGVAEEFLFTEEVKGDFPDKFLKTHRGVIIKQDAEMLAKLCLNGYRKQGFWNFDDKIFDGKHLYLIDVDECVDLYGSIGREQYKEILMNPLDKSRLREFRKFQKAVFKGQLKDAIFDYRKTLLPGAEDAEFYIKNFYETLKWKEPDERQIKLLTNFQKDYMTNDQFVSMMNDE